MYFMPITKSNHFIYVTPCGKRDRTKEMSLISYMDVIKGDGLIALTPETETDLKGGLNLTNLFL
jgi:hypothetical protein